MWARLGKVLDAFAEPMIIVNAKGDLLCLNRGAREVLGAKLSEGMAALHPQIPESVNVFSTEELEADSIEAAMSGGLLARSQKGLHFLSGGMSALLGVSRDALVAGEKSPETALEEASRIEYDAWLKRADWAKVAQEALEVQTKEGRLLEMQVRRSLVPDVEGQFLEVLWLKPRESGVSHWRNLSWNCIVEPDAFRAELERRLEAWKQGAANSNFAVAMIEYSRWRRMESAFGREAARDAMTEAAFRLENAIGPEDLVARFGTAEFVVLLSGIHSKKHAAERVGKALELLNQPYERDGQQYSLTARAGVVYPENLQVSVDVLLRDGDAALELAKRRKQNLASLPEVKEIAPPHVVAMEIELRQAIEQNEIYFEFQPIYEVASGKIAMVEALSRWRHPRLGLVAPTSFIEAAEDSGLVLELDVQGLKRLSEQVARWRQNPNVPEKLAYTINLSGCHFPAFVNEDRILKLLSSEPLRSSRVALEVTETAFLEGDSVTVGHFRRLREAGVEIWLDDFGEGHSSLRYLMDFPVDGIKVSEVFVRRAVEQPKARAILASIRKLTHALGLGLVAEGVETREQWELLGNLGYDLVQGYYYSRAVPADQIPAASKSAGSAVSQHGS